MAIQKLSWSAAAAAFSQSGAVAIGNFDGVHRGHAALVKELCAQAHSLHGPAIALTFNPHPLQLLRPEQFQPVLTTMNDRAQLLQEYGADHVIILKTTPELLRFSPEQFFDQVILRQLEARAL